MRKKLSIILILSLMLFLFNSMIYAQNEFAGGSGTETDPYLVKTADHLNKLRNYSDKYFKQIADIYLSREDAPKNWKAIGENFSGQYNGNNYKIINLVIVRKNAGLFLNLTESAVVKNINLINVNITANESIAGAIAGSNEGKIENCFVQGFVRKGSDLEISKIGGLVGQNYGKIENSHFNGKIGAFKSVGGLAGVNEGIIENSSAKGILLGNDENGGLVGSNTGEIIECTSNMEVKDSGSYVGGIAGYSSGYIKNCIALEDVKGRGHAVGGLVGSNTYEGKIIESYAEGNVTGNTVLGGLTGINDGLINMCFATGNVKSDGNVVGGLVGNNIGLIKNSYAKGNVTGWYYIGGFVGILGPYQSIIMVDVDKKIVNSYASGEVSGESDLGGFVGKKDEDAVIKNSFYNQLSLSKNNEIGTAKLPEEMMKKSTYSGWDFNQIWKIENGKRYPLLKWSEKLVLKERDYNKYDYKKAAEKYEAFKPVSPKEFFKLAESGTPQKIKKEIEKGVDITLRLPRLGMTPFLYAAWKNNDPDVLQVFLEAGCEINASTEEFEDPNYDLTVLMCGALNSNQDIIKFLIDNGADINKRNSLGRTALMYAAKYNQNPEVIKILAKEGADLNSKDNKGKDVLDYASENKNNEIYNILVMR